MVATAMLIAVRRGLKFTEADLANPIPWLTGLIHERKAFPLFGQTAPIRTITNNSEADVLVTLDDGLQIFLRYGVYNKVYETTSGGLCYAEALQSFNKSGYSIIEVDQQGQLLFRKNNDGTFSGFITDFMYSPSPILADFRNTPYKNRFQISFSPVEMVNNGVIFQGGEELLSLTGLVDSELVQDGVATTTKLKIGVQTVCAETDLVDLIGDELAQVSNFIVTNKATGAAVVVSAAAVVAGAIELTGSFASGQTFIVEAASPSIWLGNEVEGYDASSSFVEIAVP